MLIVLMKAFSSALASHAALALGVASCAAMAACHSTGGDPATSHVAVSRVPSPVEAARSELDERLVDTEAKLAASKDETERGELAARRLVLTVALVELDRRVAAGETAAPNVEGLIASVELMLAAPRHSPRRAPRTAVLEADKGKGDVATGEVPPREEKDGDLLRAVDKPLEMHRRGEPKPKLASGPRGGVGEDDDGFTDTEDEGEPEGKAGRIEKARVEVESRPRGLMTAVQRQLGAMEACLGELDDDVTLQVTVSMDAGGAVRIAKVGGVGATTASCVARVLQRVRVPGHDGGTRIVRFPLYFQPN